MALDRRKGLQTAERLLKQGKLQAALSELQRVSESAPNDLLTLNRLGDLLARQGRRGEAISYYMKIAGQFEKGGFVPKAIAIHKKILRLDPQKLDSMVALGHLYLEQRLNGEARSYLLHASNQYLQSKDFERARAIFEKLVEAEPDDARHRVRLAETRAAEGHGDQASRELVRLGQTLLASGKPEEADKIFARARELAPAADEPVLGLVSSFNEQGRTDEALAVLEHASRQPDATPRLVGEVALCYEQAGRSSDAIDALKRTRVFEVPVNTLHLIFRTYLQRNDIDRCWSRMGPLFERGAALGHDVEPLVAIYESLAELEPAGHIPALQRLLELHTSRDDHEGSVRTLEWLVRCYHGRSMHDEASLMADRLRGLSPESPVLVDDSAEASPIDPAADAISAPTAASRVPQGAVSAGATAIGVPESELVGEIPPEFSTPAVPLSKADQEFVAGRVTQAEVLEKYGLRQQALDQLDEVAAKFPGHVDAMRRRVAMLRLGNQSKNLHDALAQLALAQRAAGEGAESVRSALEAASSPELERFLRRALTQTGLVAPAVAAAPARSARRAEGHDVDILVDLDGADADGPESEVVPVVSIPIVGAARVVTPPAPAPIAAKAPGGSQQFAPPSRPAAAETRAAAKGGGRATREPSADMLEEIRYYIEQDNLRDAQRRIDALNSLGYASNELDELTRAVASVPAPAVAAPAPPAPRRASDVPPGTFDLGNDDDLNAITAALESELFDVDSAPLIPEEDPEQSIDEVFAAFRQQVQQEVGAEDHRTHYDLGIAYKEMGLVGEAISEFEAALGSNELYCESCSMIAMCHAELEDMGQAAHWYRRAIERANGDAQVLSGLRYDLADVLLKAGDSAGALDLFRDVMQHDPTYRDVRGRVSALEPLP